MNQEINLTTQFKSLANVLTNKQQRKLVKKGSKHKDYAEIVSFFQDKFNNNVLNIKDIYIYVNQYGLNSKKLNIDSKLKAFTPAILFIHYLKEIVVPNSNLGTYMGEFYVTGTNFIENMSELIQDMKINDRVRIVAEVNNPHDFRAVKVRTKDKVKIGYIPKNKNYFPSAMLQNGEKLFGQIKKVQWEQDEFVIKIMLFCKK